MGLDCKIFNLLKLEIVVEGIEGVNQQEAGLEEKNKKIKFDANNTFYYYFFSLIV